MTDEEEILIVQSRKLFAAWDKFQKALPKEQRKDVTSKPDLKVLFGAVQTSSKTWQQQSKNTKRGKVKSAFGGLCQHLQDHQSILNLIPNQSEYFSLLCGSLTTVILVSQCCQFRSIDVVKFLTLLVGRNKSQSYCRGCRVNFGRARSKDWVLESAGRTSR